MSFEERVRAEDGPEALEKWRKLLSEESEAMQTELSGYPDPAEDNDVLWLRKLAKRREPVIAARITAIADEMERLIRGHNEYNAANRILTEQADTIEHLCKEALDEKSGFNSVGERKRLARNILTILDT